MHDGPPYDGGHGEEPTWNGMNVLTVVLPFAATVVSLVFGMFIGGAAVWIVKPEQRPIEYLKTASLAELQLVCEPVVEEQKSQLTKIKSEISVLEIEVADKEAQVASLREQLEGKGTQDTAAIERKLAKARGQLAEAKLELRLLAEVKEQLVEQLARTQERLAEAEEDLQQQATVTEVLRDENVDLQDDVVVQRWFRLVNEAQLQVCEKGSKRKTESCRDAVRMELAKVKREFVHCIRSKQATPSVELLAKGKGLPHFARMLDQNNRYLAGYYLQMCDPTLPEVEYVSPAAAVATP